MKVSPHLFIFTLTLPFIPRASITLRFPINPVVLFSILIGAIDPTVLPEPKRPQISSRKRNVHRPPTSGVIPCTEFFLNDCQNLNGHRSRRTHYGSRILTCFRRESESKPGSSGRMSGSIGDTAFVGVGWAAVGAYRMSGRYWCTRREDLCRLGVVQKLFGAVLSFLFSAFLVTW